MEYTYRALIYLMTLRKIVNLVKLMNIVPDMNKKKTIPITGLCGPEGSGRLRFPDY